jgi:hypothetical protein
MSKLEVYLQVGINVNYFQFFSYFFQILKNYFFLTSLLTANKIPAAKLIIIKLEPQLETNGSVIQVSGIIAKFTQIFINAWKTIHAVIHTAKSIQNLSFALFAIISHLYQINKNTETKITTLINHNSSEIIAKIVSH